MLFRYSRWDGTQRIDPFTADDVMEHVAEEMLERGSLRRALERLMQRGGEFSSGRRMMGLQEMLDRLRQARQERLSRYNLDSVFDDIKQRLDQVVQTERQGIQRKLEQTRQPGVETSESSVERPDSNPEGHTPGSATDDVQPSTFDAQPPDPSLQQLLERMARQRLDQLDQLPPDAGGRIRQLRDYEFMDPDARQQFQELLQMLQQQVMQNYFKGLQQSIQNMTPEALREMGQMVRDLNRLMQQRLQGQQPDFDEFMRKWGQYFPEGIQDVDQLAEHMQQQIAQMQALLDSMSPEQRRELESMLQALFQDSRLLWDLAQLAANLDRLHPMPRSGDFPFGGEEPLSLQQAMDLMGDMTGLDQLERELMQAIRSNDASHLDADDLGRLLGDETREMLEQMQQLTKMLEEAGLIQRKGKDWELTPRAIRQIGQRAVQDIFSRLKRNVLGDHELERRGAGSERLDETKPYVFGDPFLVDTQRSVMNALRRQGPGTPVRLDRQDFEVYSTTEQAHCSTVIMLDMSYSMLAGGHFNAGRKVALALDSLIRAQFPRDTLYVVAFSYFVLPLSPEMLLDTYWVEYGGGTNFQEALRQARQLLARHKQGTRQVILITDGEPTSYSYRSRWDEDWALGGYRGGLEETLREVWRCTRESITINTFMMAHDPALTDFVRLMSRVNHGRAFFASPQKLGEYLLVDYLQSRSKWIRG